MNGINFSLHIINLKTVNCFIINQIYSTTPRPNMVTPKYGIANDKFHPSP
jgi:hypothetical protein